MIAKTEAILESPMAAPARPSSSSSRCDAQSDPTAPRSLASRAFSARRRQLIVLGPVMCLGLVASVWVWANTAHDIDQSDPDGGAYIGVADQLRSGHGPTSPSTYKYDDFSPRAAVAFRGEVPSTHFPPGYPATLASTSLVTGTTRDAARMVNVLAAFVNVLLLGVLAARMTAYRSIFAAAAPVLLVMFVPDHLIFDGPGWLQIHLGVFSEPLFIALVTAVLLVATTAVTETSARRRSAMVVATGLSAAALLTRYAGIAIVLTVAVGCLWFGRQRLAQRARWALLFGVSAIAPTALFLLWSAHQGASGARAVAYHPGGREKQLVERLGHFFFPLGWPQAVVFVGLAVLAVAAAVVAFWLPPRAQALWRGDDRGRALLVLAMVFVVSFLAVLVFTTTFLDATTPYGARLVAPVRGVAYAVVVAVVHRGAMAYLRPVVVTAVLAMAITGLVLADWHLQGQSLTNASRAPRRLTPTERALAELPDDALIVTDAPYVAYLRAGRSSLVLPQRTEFLTREVNPEFEQQVSKWANILDERGGYAFFAGGFFMATPKDLGRELRLELISRSGDQALYRIPPQPS